MLFVRILLNKLFSLVIVLNELTMKFIKYPFYIFLRIWFYLMMGLPLIIFAPILIVLTFKQSWYPLFFKVARVWGSFILLASGFIPVRKSGVFNKSGESFMIIGNHTSMLDIMLMLHTVKNPFVFVGKKELTKIPVFGYFYRRTCILVDRGDSKSRRKVFEQAEARIKQGLSICIFPEGGVPEDETLILDQFKDGAFRLAIEHQLPILPLLFPDNKKRFSYSFLSGSMGKTRSYILPIITTNAIEIKNKLELRKKTYTIMYNKLSKLIESS